MSFAVHVRRDLLRRAIAFKVQRLQLASLSALSQHAAAQRNARTGSLRVREPAAVPQTCPLESPTPQPGLQSPPQPPLAHRQEASEEAALLKEGSCPTMAGSRQDVCSPGSPPRGMADVRPHNSVDLMSVLQLAQPESPSAGLRGGPQAEHVACDGAAAAKKDVGMAVQEPGQAQAPADMLGGEWEPAVSAVTCAHLLEKLPGSCSAAERPAEVPEIPGKQRHSSTQSSNEAPIAELSRPPSSKEAVREPAAQQAEQAEAAGSFSALEAGQIMERRRAEGGEAEFSGRPKWDGELAAVFGVWQEATVMQWRHRLAAVEPLMRRRRWR